MKIFVTAFHTLRFAIVFGLCPLLFAVEVAQAQNATWATAPIVVGPDPGTFDWNAATNWMPATVPTGTATMGPTTGPAISFSSAATTIGAVQFAAMTSVYSIQVNPTTTFTINGAGVTNSSVNSQVIDVETNVGGQHGVLEFHNSATAGSNIFYTAQGALAMNAVPAIINFRNSSTAGDANFLNAGSSAAGGGGGATQFLDTGTSAGTANFANLGTAFAGAFGGITNFLNGTAANATIQNNGAQVASMSTFDHTQGRTIFQNSATAENATIINQGSAFAGGFGGSTEFIDTSTAGNSTITNNGGTTAGAHGGLTLFSADPASITQASNAGTSTLIANAGSNGGEGGEIRFIFYSSGATARVEVFGNGRLDISFLFSEGTTIGSLEGNGNVFLGSKNLDIGGNDMDTTFSGLIQDGGVNPETGGSISKSGLGTLTLTSDNTYTGGTTVNDGVLAVGSLHALGTGDVTVHGGTLQTANGPRTIAVGGNYLQDGGTLRLQIGGPVAGTDSELLAVTGGATLGGTLSLVQINGFTPTPGQRVTIITVDNGHSDEFADVISDFPGMLQPVVKYDEPFDVYIVFQITSFVLDGLTPNQRAVAHQLNQVMNDPRASDLIDFLVTEQPEDLPHDYDLIAPEELASMYEISFSQSFVQNMNLQHRLDDVRAGSTGFSSNGYSMNTSGTDVTKEDGKVVAPTASRDVMVPGPDNRWGVWVTGSGNFVDVGNNDDNAHGYDITTGNVLIGVDYRLSDHFVVGIAGGYSGSWSDLVDNGRVEADGGRGGIYASLYNIRLLGSNVHVDAAVNGGWNNYDTRRYGLEEVLPQQGDFAHGDTDGCEFNALLAYGADWMFGRLLVGTWSMIQYTNVDLNSFTEDGSLAPLHFPDQDEDSIRSSTGIRLAYNANCGGAVIRPEVRAAWQHDSGDRAYPIRSQFASGAGDVFTVHGPKIGSDSAVVDAGVSIPWNSRISTYIYYSGILGRDNYDNNAVSGGFRFSF